MKPASPRRCAQGRIALPVGTRSDAVYRSAACAAPPPHTPRLPNHGASSSTASERYSTPTPTSSPGQRAADLTRYGHRSPGSAG
ncbi:hypothetical protein OG948_59825 (plasmid) [Embleya sp. NBC_00888]|uniref:hypothetical protein n=1 Tax=Embleya sp. NBC_00888 TaxID=2975960 RepID=UPI00386B2044|nr:hypothetical protein OG948_59825 [Embleya sp. NBC_00888]